MIDLEIEIFYLVLAWLGCVKGLILEESVHAKHSEPKVVMAAVPL